MGESLYSTGSPTNETSEPGGVTLGTVLIPQVSGPITHLVWYCPAVKPINESSFPFLLYDATTQAQLRRVVVSSLTANTRNTVALTTPYEATAGQRLISAVYTVGQYAFTPNHFTVDRGTGIVRAPASANDPIGNGRFRTAAEGVPLSTFGNHYYWNDIVMEEAVTGPIVSVWNGSIEVPATIKVWNGTTEVAAAIDSII